MLVPSIAVIGYGCVSAAGRNAEVAAENIRAGVAAHVPVAGGFFPGDFTAPCFLVQDQLLQPFSGMPSAKLQQLSRLNRTILLALTAIEEALKRAGMSVADLQEKRVGIALGTTVGCTFHNEEYYRQWQEGIEPDSGPLFTYLRSNISHAVQDFLGVKGPRLVVTNACASGTDAIGIAKSWLEHGLCDIAIGGGADELSRIACHGFKSLMLVSREECRPFDRDRKGLNLGEGSGIVLLETEKNALAGKRNICGWIRGYGIAGDAHHPTAPDPEGRGLQQALGKALHNGGITGGMIGMINAHGTGTPANDLAETNALAAMGFDDAVPVVSTKGATGHTLGAAGGIEAVFTLMALNRGEVSGTIGCENPDPKFAFQVLPSAQNVSFSGRVGISQSLAFGGSNSALVIEGAGV